MFDKLEFRTDQKIDIKEIERSCPTRSEMFSSPIYKNVLYILTAQRNEYLFIIHTDPRWPDIAPTKISCNPSRWSSFDEFKKALSKFCDPELLEITRIDHAVDLEIPIEELYQGIRVKHKTKCDSYKEHCSTQGAFVTGFYLGVEPELYCIYDKGYQVSIRSKKKFKRVKGIDRGLISRVELRQFKKKIKFRRLNELEMYLTEPPFKNIEFYESNETTEKAKALQTLMNRDGLQRTFARFNEHKNFKRNHSKHLAQIDIEIQLHNLYKENLRRFFGRSK